MGQGYQIKMSDCPRLKLDLHLEKGTIRQVGLMKFFIVVLSGVSEENITQAKNIANRVNSVVNDKKFEVK